MKNINVTSGEYLNKHLKNKSEGVFIPFNESMIQGTLLYPLFDKNFIKERCLVHYVSDLTYKEKMGEFINIKNNIEEVDLITLWFGKDVFCIVNLLTVLVYLEEVNYRGKVLVNLVDDHTNEILEYNIELALGKFKNIYLNLKYRKQIETNICFIDEGIKDYLYITSDNNHVIEYIKENINKVSEYELLISVIDKTYKYGLTDTYITSMINKIKGK